MKKIAILLILLAPLLMAQDIIYTSSAVVEWDAVTTLGNGDPIPAGWTVEYEIFISDPETSIGTITQTEIDISVTWNTHRYVGVRAVMNDGTMIHYSNINWSNVNGTQTPDPFTLVGVQPPAVPLGLRVR